MYPRVGLAAVFLIASCGGGGHGDGGIDGGRDGAPADVSTEACACPAIAPKCCPGAAPGATLCVSGNDPGTGCGGPDCDPCPAPAHATPICSDAVCAFYCESGFGDCDADPANGCEMDVRTSLDHCGTCGHPCVAPGVTASSCEGGFCEVVSCEPDLADCNGDHDDGCEIDIRTSAVHCGACREPCLEGLVCEARECVGVSDATVVVLATDQELGRTIDPPCRIAVDGDDVFFVGELHASRVPRAGGALPERLFAPSMGGLSGVAADATEVIVGGTAGVIAIDRTTGAVRTITTARAACVAVDGPTVFFTDGLAALFRVDRAGGSAPVELARPGAAGVSCVALDATDVYFSAEGPTIAPGLSVIGRVARGGGPLTNIYTRADTLTGVECLALDGGSVYFVVSAALRRITLDGMDDTLLASLDTGPGVIPQHGLAANADLVWAAHPGRGAIARVPGGGGAATILTTRGVPHSVAIDADRVYWTSPDSREVFSAVR